MIRVLIADDQELIRESLKIVLSAYPDIEVVGAVSDGTEVLETLPTSKPDVILMDIRMPKMDGVLCTKAVKEHYPNIKVIILTTFDDDDFIYSALKYGATGYMLKGTSMDDLHDAVVTANEGRAMINPDIATKVFKLFHKWLNQILLSKLTMTWFMTLAKWNGVSFNKLVLVCQTKKLLRSCICQRERCAITFLTFCQSSTCEIVRN